VQKVEEIGAQGQNPDPSDSEGIRHPAGFNRGLSKLRCRAEGLSTRRVSHLRRWGVFGPAFPALTRWANLWRAYGATKSNATADPSPPSARSAAGFGMTA